jgi:hypothetical protein
MDWVAARCTSGGVMGGMKQYLNRDICGRSLDEMAELLGGEVADEGVIRCPSPGYPADDRSCEVQINPDRPEQPFVYYCKGNIAAVKRDILNRLGIFSFQKPDGNAERARRIWDETKPAPGTLVERYLRGRGIAVPVPLSLRFHPGLHHQSGSPWPAMVAEVSDPRGDWCAVHRTWLAYNGNGKAPVDKQKMSLGPVGKGAVRLAPAASKLIVAEGIETALSAMFASGIGAWSAVSAGGVAQIVLPPEVRRVILAADNDRSGINAAEDAAKRFGAEGRIVKIVRPPAGFNDFNDLLRAK